MVVLASTFKPVLSFASVPPPLAILSRPYSHTLLTRGGSSRTGAPSLPPTAGISSSSPSSSYRPQPLGEKRERREEKTRGRLTPT